MAERYLANWERFRDFSKGDFAELLKRSHKAWQSGRLDSFSPKYRLAAEHQKAENFSQEFDENAQPIRFAFKNSPPAVDEYLIESNSGGTKMSFVLTNLFFYYFGLDKELLAAKYESGKVDMEAIESCSVKTGIHGTTLTLRLVDEHTLVARDLQTDLPYQYIQFRLGQDYVTPFNEEGAPEEIANFAISSYAKWREGYLDSVNDTYKETAEEESAIVMADKLLNDNEAMATVNDCFTLQKPDADEVLTGFSPNCFMLSDKHLWFYSGGSKLVAFHLCEIAEYGYNGFWKRSGSVVLQSGDQIQFELDDAPDPEIVQALQQNLGCERVIAT